MRTANSAIDGYSAEYEADQLNDELKDIVSLLGLEDGSYESFAASVSSMMVRIRHCYRKARRGQDRCREKPHWKPGVQSEQQSMEHYLEDQHQVAKVATVTVAPTGEVVPGVRRGITTPFFPTSKKPFAA